MKNLYVGDINDYRKYGRMTGDALRDRLLGGFQALHRQPPAWAWPYAPPLPFLGTEYAVGSGLLIYASAENLAWMNRRPVPDRFTSERVWDRYRAVYQDEGRDSGDFFPVVGMATGGAARFPGETRHGRPRRRGRRSRAGPAATGLRHGRPPAAYRPRSPVTRKPCCVRWTSSVLPGKAAGRASRKARSASARTASRCAAVGERAEAMRTSIT